MKAFPRPGLRSCPAIAAARCRLQRGVPSAPHTVVRGDSWCPAMSGNPGEGMASGAHPPWDVTKYLDHCSAITRM